MAKKEEDAPGYLPGMAEKQDPVLSKQCARLLEAQAEKHEAAGRYNDIHAKLMEQMQERGIKSYKHNASGKVFQIESTSKVKHKNLKDKVESNAINPASDDDGADDDLDEVGESDALGGLQDIAAEGAEGEKVVDQIEKKKSKLAGYKRAVKA